MALVKTKTVEEGLRKIGIEESLIRALITDMSKIHDASILKDQPWKRQFPCTLFVMEPLTKREDLTHEVQEFPGYSGTDDGEADDVYAVYELMGFVKVVERKTKETIDV